MNIHIHVTPIWAPVILSLLWLAMTIPTLFKSRGDWDFSGPLIFIFGLGCVCSVWVCYALFLLFASK